MKWFTRQWWFFDSCRMDFDAYAVFREYDCYVKELADSGVPVVEELSDPCRTHDYVVTRVLVDKESFTLVLRDGDLWEPYTLHFIRPDSVICIGHANGDEHTSFELLNLLGAGIGYAEYSDIDTPRYRYSMIFDRDFTVDVELENMIVFKPISMEEANDHEAPLKD